MDDFLMRPEDEQTHAPDDSPNFNESVYTNGFDSVSPVGGWMRLGNRVNEGYAELSVCLYLPDGRIACQFRRPSIGANDRFAAGGLSYAVIEPLRKVSISTCTSMNVAMPMRRVCAPSPVPYCAIALPDASTAAIAARSASRLPKSLNARSRSLPRPGCR